MTEKSLISILMLAVSLLILSGCSSNSDALDGDIEDGDTTETELADGDDVDSTETDGDMVDGDVDVDLDEEKEWAETEADDFEYEEGTGGFEPISALVACGSIQSSCGTVTVDNGIYASYRKDYFLPSEQYSEPLDDPVDGGRFHIAAISQTDGTVTGVFINDTPVADLLTELSMDWQHVWPEQVEAGKPVWFAFHSRNSSWDSAESGHIRIETDNGIAVNGEFEVRVRPISIGYVTVNDARDTLLIHVTNTGDEALTISRVFYNGVNLVEEHAICIPSQTLKPGEHALWSAPLCEAPVSGSAWTVVINAENQSPVAAVGRHLNPFFPIEAWQKGGDCALPGVNDTATDFFLAGAIDTFYHYWNGGDRCDYDNASMFNDTLPARGDVHVLLGDDFPFDNPPLEILTDTSAIAGILTGDESDWSYTTDEGGPKPENKATRARKVWRAYPELLTYNGAMTNKHIGAFAGMTDIQGIDIYAAGCAPHILAFGDHPPLRAPFDYLRNARNNHMPWPTWLYSQGLGGWTINPDPQEILVQGFEVVAAGGKGLMWFQAGTELAEEFPDTWQAMSDVNWMIRGVRPLLREGDVTGLASSDDDTIVEAIRSPEALIVPVITLAANTTPTDQDCLLYGLGQLEDEPHWILTERTISVSVTIQDDMAVNDVFEVFPDRVDDIPYPVAMDGRRILLNAIPVSNEIPVRLFVFAREATLRNEITERLRGE